MNKRATMSTGGDGKQRPAKQQPTPTDKTKKK